MSLAGARRDRDQRSRNGWALAILIALLSLLAAPGSASAAPPPNDDFADATELLGGSPVSVGTTVEATVQAGEPNHAGDSGGTSVWYRWTPARSGLIRLSCDSSFETLLAVYRGTSVGSLVEVGSDHSGTQCASPDLEFRAAAGVEYRIAVDGAIGGGEFILTLSNTSPVPENDDFAHATTIQSGASYANRGTTEGAGRETGEPVHGGSQTGSSVWFTWTAKQSGTAQVLPCHGGFHPVLGVYRGSSVTALTPVGTPSAYPAVPETPGGGGLRSCSLGGLGGVSFPAVAGQAYAIAVDGAGGQWGWFNLMVIEPVVRFVAPPPDTFIRKQIKVSKGTAKILFAARRGVEARYRCKLDRRPFRSCWSPKTYTGLSVGRHRFAVVAIDESGTRDPTPAVRHFRIFKPGPGR